MPDEATQYGEELAEHMARVARQHAAGGRKASSWICPTCGSQYVPVSWRRVKAEWDELDEGPREAARELLAMLYLHGDPKGRGFADGVWDALRLLLPSIDDAWMVAEKGLCDFLPIFPDDEGALAALEELNP